MDKFTIPPGYPGRCTPDKLKKLADKLKDNPGFRERLSNAGTRKNQRNVISRLLGAGTHTMVPSDREQLRRHFLLYFGIANPPGELDQCREDRTLLFMLDPPRWKDDGEDPAAATKPPSLKELIETKLGPNPDPMQDFRSHAARQMLDAMQSMRKLLDEGGVPVQNPVFCVPASWRDDILSSPEFGLIDTFRFISTSPSYQSLPKKETMNTKPLTITTKTFTYVNGVDINNFTSAELYDLIAREEAQIRKLSDIHHKPVMLQQEIERRQAGIAALVAHLDSITVVANPVDAKTEAQITAAVNA